MRNIIFFIFVFIPCFLMAAVSNKKDTMVIIDDGVEVIKFQDKRQKGEIKVTEILGDPIRPRTYKRSEYPPFKGHWSSFTYGFVNFTNKDYSKYSKDLGEFMELDGSNSFFMQFNVVQTGFRLNKKNNLGLVTGLGLEYQRFRFDNKNTIIKGTDGVIIPDYYDNRIVKKSSFKNMYLNVPLLLEVQFPAKKVTRFYISSGFMAGLRLHTKTKIVYKNEDGKNRRDKNSGNFNVNPVKVDVVGRMGYGRISLYGSYSLTKLFKSNKGPELNAYSFGASLNF